MEETKEITAQQIEQWKQQHKDIYQISVDDKTCYVRKPKRQELSYAMVGSNGGKDIVKMQEILVKSCWLGGDEEMMTDDSMFFALAEKVSELIPKKEAELKKL